jgi:hypothetical protein
MENKLVEVYVARGWPQAEMLRMFLEAHDITPLVSAESVSQTYAVPGTFLGLTKIYVPKEQETAARELLAALDRGDFELPDEEEPGQEL